MLTVYTTSESLYCAKLRVLLRHKGAKWQESEPEGGCGSEAYRKLIPSGTMPALVDGSLVIADSEAIAEYLNEKIPTPNMLPADPAARAKCRERSRFHDTRLEPEVRKLFAHIAPGARDTNGVANQNEVLNLRLQELSRLLATDTFLDIDLLVLGDCGFPISFAWLDAFTPVLGLELDWPVNLLDYRTGVEAHTAVAAELEDYSAGMQAWLDLKLG